MTFKKNRGKSRYLIVLTVIIPKKLLYNLNEIRFFINRHFNFFFTKKKVTKKKTENNE